MPDLPCLPLMFGEQPLTLVLLGHRAALSARAVGTALGYGRDGGRLTRLIRRDWRGMLVPGVDLAALRVGQSAEPRYFLYETGLLLVLGRSRKPAAKDLRSWWITEASPRLARRGANVIRLVPRERQVTMFEGRGELRSLDEALVLVRGLGLSLDELAHLDVAVEDRKAVAR